MTNTRQFLTPVLPGTCPICGVPHAEDKPHCFKSLFFKYWFYDRFGRMPTEADASMHIGRTVDSNTERADAP